MGNRVGFLCTVSERSGSLLEPDGLGAGIITAIPKFLRMIGDSSGTSRRRLRNRSAVDFGSGNGTSLLSVEII